MRKYESPEMKIIAIDAEDLIATSNGLEGWAPDSDDSEFGG